MTKIEANFILLFRSVFFYNIVCLISSVFFQSRSFVIGYTVSAAFVLLSYYQFKIRKKHLFLIISAIIIFGTLLSSCMKVDSSLGRMLIYKISIQMLNDHYLSGVGWGKFPLIYGEYQTEYFRNGTYTTKEFLLADNTKHAFNDYLQFFIEMGIPGLVILILFLLFITRSIIKSLEKNPQHPAFLILALSQIIAISVAALFMHVFEKIWFQGLFVSALIVIIYYAYFYKHKLYKCLIMMMITISGIVYFHYAFFIKNYTNYQKFKEAKQSFQTGYIREAYTYNHALYPYLKEDISFLSHYATVLTAFNYHEEAEQIMELIVQQDNASLFNQKLADCYFNNGKMKKAEDAYLLAVYRVPNRFSTRFSLFNFYIENKQYDKALLIGKSILNLPVKIPSVRVLEIKKDVANTLLLKSLK